LVAANRSLTPRDLSSTGIARRTRILQGDGLISSSEILLASVLKSTGLINVLRSDPSKAAQRTVDRIVKMAAAQLQTRGVNGFIPEAPAPSLVASEQPAQPVQPPPVQLIAAEPAINNIQSSVVSGVPTDQTPVRLQPQTERINRPTVPTPPSSAPRKQDTTAPKLTSLTPTMDNVQPNAASTLSYQPDSSQTTVSEPSLARNAAPSVQRSVADKSHETPVRVLIKTVVQRYPEAVAAALFVIGVLLLVSGYLLRTTMLRARKIEALNSDLESNLSELALMNERMSQARDEALEASNLKSQFVANISHELRTPLGIILGLNDILLESKLTADQKEHAEQSQDAAKALLAIVNDLLDFSKIEGGQLALSTVTFSPAQVVSHVVEMLEQEAHEKGIKLTATVAKAMPGKVQGDSARLQQVLLNIVGNAVKFTNKGSVKIIAMVVQESSAEQVKLGFEIKDTGIGIPPSAMSRLFQPFVQADGSKTRQFEGTGLGLSIAKRLVDLMGGAISVESAPGKGSTFTVEVPFALLKRVLLVEENMMVRRMLQMRLQNMGFVVDVAANATEANEAASKADYAAILVDRDMPEIEALSDAKLYPVSKPVSDEELSRIVDKFLAAEN
jgi:signal transduction histidine kinase